MTTTSPKHDCCEPNQQPAASQQPVKRGFLPVLGAVFAATIASACCWLPLALIGMGASAAGIGTAFETWRPLMLGITAVFLLIGYWYAYRPQPSCDPGSACATVPAPRRRGMRISLSLVTVLVAVIAAFPWWSSLIIANGTDTSNAKTTIDTSTQSVITFSIDGMTCAGCASTLQQVMKAVPGVVSVDVSYANKTARIIWLHDLLTRQQLLDQIGKVMEAEGYHIHPGSISVAPNSISLRAPVAAGCCNK